MTDSKKYTSIAFTFLVFLVSVVYLYTQLFVVPSSFPVGKNFVINENESVKSVSERLAEEGYISSALFFRAGISFLGKDRAISLGGYVFSEPQPLLGVMSRLSHGRPSVPLLSVTIPEGSTSFEIGDLVSKIIPSISVDVFGEMVSKHEADGKLFPSTYFLLPSQTAEDIVKMMMSTFSKKMTGIVFSSVPVPLKGEHDVLVLASILEGEAKTQEDMETVAGILLARLQKGMPLQVDVAKETYKAKGLPFMPINNPGLVAINAVLHPIYTEYLYYITGNDGLMHYAKTFEEHKKNIRKYLK